MLLALIRGQQQRAREATEPSGGLLFGVWGLAWLAGYLVLFLGWMPAAGTPAGWAFFVFAGLLAAAMVFTGIHIGRRSAGVRGDSAVTGTLYGWSWAVSFAAVFLILTGVARAGATVEVMSVLANSLCCLVVAALYMAGGVIWREWRMFALGAWIALISGAAAMAGAPAGYLVMAVAGGGGMLLAAAADLVNRRRERSRAAVVPG
ncbi:hypothetical protein [Arthrobacter mobilis]|uniref:Uncharacterized protein n=1 Tax=Arthrobacter mobilis TaxID=2724944 RepID=A0A7X6HFL0_9MICC|nr:hypothetical protein [Arthrobacter mobilis]NKX56156.1 hypothetical protein [Arthrobacter mobilis]